MFWQRLAHRPRLELPVGLLTLRKGFGLRLGGLILFQFQFQLFELENQLLALGSVQHLAILLNLQLQLLDALATNPQFFPLRRQSLELRQEFRFELAHRNFLAAQLLLLSSEDRAELLPLFLLRADQRQQRVAIQRAEIGNRGVIHAESMPSQPPSCMLKTRINTGESASSSHCDLGLPSSLHATPIDAFQKHRKLGSTDVYHSALRLRPDEPTSLQTLRKKTKTIAVEPQALHDVAASAAKNKDMSGKWLLLENGLHLRAETVKATTHIGDAGRYPDLGSNRKLDHLRRLSSIDRNKDGSAPLSTLIKARPGNSM